MIVAIRPFVNWLRSALHFRPSVLRPRTHSSFGSLRVTSLFHPQRISPSHLHSSAIVFRLSGYVSAHAFLSGHFCPRTPSLSESHFGSMLTYRVHVSRDTLLNVFRPLVHSPYPLLGLHDTCLSVLSFLILIGLALIAVPSAIPRRSFRPSPHSICNVRHCEAVVVCLSCAYSFHRHIFDRRFLIIASSFSGFLPGPTAWRIAEWASLLYPVCSLFGFRNTRPTCPALYLSLNLYSSLLGASLVGLSPIAAPSAILQESLISFRHSGPLSPPHLQRALL